MAKPWSKYRRWHGRLLEPGYAGEPTLEELAVIEAKLAGDQELAKLWGFSPSAGAPSPQAITEVALHGDPANAEHNREIVLAATAHKPVSGLTGKENATGYQLQLVEVSLI